MCPFLDDLKWEPTREECHHCLSKNTTLTLLLVININILGGHHKNEDCKWKYELRQ